MSRLGVRTAAALLAVAGAAAFGALLAGAPSSALLGVLAGGGLGAGVAGVWLIHRTRRPLHTVAVFADRLAEGDLTQRLAGFDRDELGALADVLNHTAQRLEQRLRQDGEAAARLAAVIAAMEEGVLVLDRDDRVVLANPRLRELLGSPSDPEGRGLLEVVRHADVVEALERAAREGEPTSAEFELDAVPRRLLRVRAAAFPRSGPRLGALAVFRDVTDVRRLEAIRRDFVANASHELKTPVAVVRGFAERLAERSLGDPSAERAVRTILSNVKRLGALVEDLLELSRVESSALWLQPRELDVAQWLASWFVELEPRFQEAKLEGHLEIDGAVPARVDPHALEHVLANLVDNAIQYTDAGGSVTIGLCAEPDRLHVRVEDTGIGISMKDLPRIFERFYRVDPARSRAVGGTGLGLSIVRHLVEAMGGMVQVESQPGRGSAFTVTLPR